MKSITQTTVYGVASLVVALSMLIMPWSAGAAGTVVVSGNTSAGENQPGWFFSRDPSTSTAYEFNNVAASIGAGSLYAGPITNTNYGGLSGNPNRDKFIGELFPGTLTVADFESFSYDFLIGTGGDAADEEQFYLNVYVNIDNSTNFYDCRFDYVPTVGSTANFTTMTVDGDDVPANVVKRGSRIANCPATLAEMPAGSHIRALTLNMGDTSANDTGLDGHFDNVVLTTSSDMTVYNFEAPLETKNQCLKGGWMIYGFKNQGQCVRFIETGKDSR